MDYGLIGGLAYYLSNSLYIGARLQFGLSDVTNNEADLSKVEFDAFTPNLELSQRYKYRDDKDKNFIIQASVGFSF